MTLLYDNQLRSHHQRRDRK